MGTTTRTSRDAVPVMVAPVKLTRPMLFSERFAYQLMSPGRQALHLVLRYVYIDVLHAPRWARLLWRQYRRTWP